MGHQATITGKLDEGSLELPGTNSKLPTGFLLENLLRSIYPDSNADVVSAVCKYVNSDPDDVDIASLEQEAGLYVSKLRPLQGRSVLYFCGLFKVSHMTSSGKKREVVCIIRRNTTKAAISCNQRRA